MKTDTDAVDVVEDDAAQTDQDSQDAVDQVAEKTAEEVAVDDAAEEAAFAGGFDGDAESADGFVDTPGDDDNPDDDQAGNDDDPDKGKAKESAAKVVAGAKEVIANMSEDQLQRLLASADKVDALTAKDADRDRETQKIFGKFGEIQRQLKQGGAQRKLGVENLKRVAQDYPELAQSIADDLSEFSSGDSPATDSPLDTTAAPGTAAPTDDRSATLEAENQALQSQLRLTEAHPDWKQIKEAPELQVWLNTQTPAYRSHFLASTDDAYVSQGLTAFKSWHKQGADQKKANKKRLENAIVPRGSGAPAGSGSLDDEAAFAQGFDSGDG